MAAQAFAGEFLMPLQLVNYTLRTMGMPGEVRANDIAAGLPVRPELGVSYRAAMTQLVGPVQLTVAAGRQLRRESPSP